MLGLPQLSGPFPPAVAALPVSGEGPVTITLWSLRRVAKASGEHLALYTLVNSKSSISVAF